jgi:hypothetical protein
MSDAERRAVQAEDYSEVDLVRAQLDASGFVFPLCMECGVEWPDCVECGGAVEPPLRCEPCRKDTGDALYGRYQIVVTVWSGSQFVEPLAERLADEARREGHVLEWWDWFPDHEEAASSN